jgi:hypothetical protein
MHTTLRRTALIASAFFVSACAADTPTAPRSLHGPTLAINDIKPPATPTPVSATIVGDIDGIRTAVLVRWIDNTTHDDELNTCAQFKLADGSPVTTQCVYASEYDLPVGSTGERSGTVVIPTLVGADSVRFHTNRFTQIETLPGEWAWISFSSERSAWIAVESGTVVTTTQARKGKGRK